MTIKTKVVERFFVCPVCGLQWIAHKKPWRMTGVGHIKHMYCFVCREIRGFIQISEWECGVGG